MSDLPVRPSKLTRLQQKAAKQREKEFIATLKAKARAAGWRYARGEIFRQSGDWFVNMTPILLWERGILVLQTIKPMALDPLFWEIVGLSANNALPLSFRARGAWVLRPPSNEMHIGLDIFDVESLADEFLSWATQRNTALAETFSIASLLSDLSNGPVRRGQDLATSICLQILAENLDEAALLCRVNEPDGHPLMREGGGFTTHNSDGSISTFVDQARDWIVQKRRSAMTVL